MFIKSTLAAVVLAVSAGASVASDVNTQLALSVGVEPGVYSLVDLVALKAADQDSQSRKAIPYILESGRNDASTKGTVNLSSMGKASHSTQLAINVGAVPGEFSTAELAIIGDAVAQDNLDQVRFIENGGLNRDTSNVVSTSPAHVQLASSLDVNAADYTLAELIILKDAIRDNDTSLVRAILN